MNVFVPRGMEPVGVVTVDAPVTPEAQGAQEAAERVMDREVQRAEAAMQAAIDRREERNRE